MKPALTDLEQAYVARAVRLSLEGGPIRVASPEDVLVFKLQGGTPQDVQDARVIAIRQRGRLDLERLRALAEKLAVRAALEAMLDESSAG